MTTFEFNDDGTLSSEDRVCRRAVLASPKSTQINVTVDNEGNMILAKSNISVTSSANINGYSVNSIELLKQNDITPDELISPPFVKGGEISVDGKHFVLGIAPISELRLIGLNFKLDIMLNDPIPKRGMTHCLMATNPYAPSASVNTIQGDIPRYKFFHKLISLFQLFEVEDLDNNYLPI